jgi:hypothetical protein
MPGTPGITSSDAAAADLATDFFDGIQTSTSSCGDHHHGTSTYPIAHTTNPALGCRNAVPVDLDEQKLDSEVMPAPSEIGAAPADTVVPDRTRAMVYLVTLQLPADGATCTADHQPFR